MPAEKLLAGDRVIGTMISLIPHPAVALLAREAGLDYLMLDMEHGPHSFETLSAVSCAARCAGVGCFVRVPELSRDNVSRALDCGADGVMVPMVESVEQARAFASWAKYPPLGKRGLGSIGGHTGFQWLDDASGHMAGANRKILTIAQIETVPGVESAGEIAAVEGIDALLIGPLDLSVSLGVPGDLLSPTVRGAIGRVCDAAGAHGKVFGIHGPESLLEEWLPRGLRLVMHSLDLTMLAAGMAGIRRWFDRER